MSTPSVDPLHVDGVGVLRRRSSRSMHSRSFAHNVLAVAGTAASVFSVEGAGPGVEGDQRAYPACQCLLHRVDEEAGAGAGGASVSGASVASHSSSADASGRVPPGVCCDAAAALNLKVGLGLGLVL